LRRLLDEVTLLPDHELEPALALVRHLEGVLGGLYGRGDVFVELVVDVFAELLELLLGTR